jgi:D-alanyl-lipoteichoic acid acyltransferase DltB (MBOAT superfamily)
MTFNSLNYVVFFAVVFLLYQIPKSWRNQKLLLLGASYLFYSAWNPPFVFLLMISTLVDWFSARWIYAAQSDRRRRALLWLSLTANLGFLGYFKYGPFVLRNFVQMVHAFGYRDYSPAFPSIVLPVGISFYTFMSLSYTLDVYLRCMRPWHSFLDYCLYVCFFPHLVAGPIVRAGVLLPQFLEPKRGNARQIGWGLVLIVLGLFEKVVLSDALLAPVTDLIYGRAQEAGTQAAWIGMISFTVQLFFDFSGYSTIAIGSALCFGFALSDNFRFPFAAIGVQDFWRRWHMTLASWFRDYVYIPLGGNRAARSRIYLNFMIVFLLTGFWHGAAWRFVVWGALQGTYVIVEDLLRRLWGQAAWAGARPVRVGLAVFTFLLFAFSLILFRSTSWGDSGHLLRALALYAPGAITLSAAQVATVLALTAGVLTMHWLLRDTTLEEATLRVPVWVRTVLVAFMLVSLCLVRGESHVFFYFQF